MTEPERRRLPDRLGALVGGGVRATRRHGRALVEVAGVSIIGIIATAGFQLVAIHGLGPAQFGLLASFLALINVVSVGSSALRNSVAVTTALARTDPSSGATGRVRRWDGSLVEALVLGLGSAVALLALSPLLASLLGASILTIVFTALAALPYFLFARAQGRLQGAERSRAVVWWSTGAQIAQLALTIVVVALRFGAVGILVVLVIVAVLGNVGAGVQARGVGVASSAPPFSLNGVVVLLLTVAFAWLTNSDVILVRSGAPQDVAGAYAAAGVIVKTILIVPATLSLYLLPRFVGRRDDVAMTRYGVNITLAITLVCGGIMFLGVLLLGPWAISVLYPGSYGVAAHILPWLAVMWVPWAAAQSVLIRVTAAASRLGLVVLAVAIVAQWGLGSLVLPNVYLMIIVNGSVGVAVLALLFAIHLRAARVIVPGPAGSSEPPMPA